MNSLASDTRLPLYQRLRDQLAEQIANNRWRPGRRFLLRRHCQPNTSCLPARCARPSMRWSARASWSVSRGAAPLFADRNFNRRCSVFPLSKRFGRTPGSREPDLVCGTGGRAFGGGPGAGVADGCAGDSHRAGASAGSGAGARRRNLVAPQPFPTVARNRPESKGPLLYPIYEETCAQVVAYAEETLTAESVNEVHARLLQVPVNSPVVVIERLARDYAGNPWSGDVRAGMPSISATAWKSADPTWLAASRSPQPLSFCLP